MRHREGARFGTSRAALLSALLSISALPQDSPAQTSIDSVPVGAVVRVWSSELRRRPQTGLLSAIHSDSLELRLGEKPRSISRISIRRLDVSVPRTRAEGARTLGLTGLAIGAATGAVLGALTSALGARYYPHGTDHPPAPPLVFEVSVGATLGGVMGVGVGALFPGHRWRTMLKSK